MTKSLTRAARRALLILAPVALFIIFVPGGSATAPGSFSVQVCAQNVADIVPTCPTGADRTSLNGGQAGAVVQITITNNGPDIIDSADIAAPIGIPIDATAGPLAATSGSLSVSSDFQTLHLASAGIASGATDTVSFGVDTICSGSGLGWSVTAKNSTSVAFDYDSPDSTGTTTDLVTGCHIGFASQPVDTQIGATITDKGASNGGAIKVGLFDQSSIPNAMSCPLANTVGCGTITITKNQADGTLGGTTTVAMSNATGIASFSDLAISSVPSGHLPESFSFSASADSLFATNTAMSGSFNLALYAQPCTSGCSFTQKLLPGAINSFADLTGGTSFDFMTLSPYSLSTRTLPTGCQNRLDLGITGFAETDGRNANGTLTLTFYVNMNNIKAKYGKNVGQQFIPMCAGGKPVDPLTHKAIDCFNNGDIVGGSLHGWKGDRLTAGKFDGHLTQAVCDSDGFYWGILGSFQDKIPAGNPVVSAWGSVTIAGATYRSFTNTVPANWDWRSGP